MHFCFFIQEGRRVIFLSRQNGKDNIHYQHASYFCTGFHFFTHTIFHLSSPIRSGTKSCSVKKWKIHPKMKQNGTDETALSSDTSTENWTGGSMFLHYVTKVYTTFPSFSFATQMMNERIKWIWSYNTSLLTKSTKISLHLVGVCHKAPARKREDC